MEKYRLPLLTIVLTLLVSGIGAWIFFIIYESRLLYMALPVYGGIVFTIVLLLQAILLTTLKQGKKTFHRIISYISLTLSILLSCFYMMIAFTLHSLRAQTESIERLFNPTGELSSPDPYFGIHTLLLLPVITHFVLVFFRYRKIRSVEAEAQNTATLPH